MSMVRNADDFLLRFCRISDDYERTFGPMLSRIREQYTNEPKKQIIKDFLEFHARTYFVNAFLAALNWRIDLPPTDGLPNLVPEVPLRSKERGSIRFMDYLGFERETDKPLLIVETKRPGAMLPQTMVPASTYSEIISLGLKGGKLIGEWNNWLATLRDYVNSVYQKTNNFPERVVITNGDWLILFLDPQDAFFKNNKANPNKILVFKDREEIEERYPEVFQFLEYHHVQGKVPSLIPSELPFHVAGQKIDRTLHGLRLFYIKQPKIYDYQGPVVKVAPVIFLRTQYGTWLRVESPSRMYELPHRYENLPAHLDEVKQAAHNLLQEVSEQLSTVLQPYPIVKHYDNEDDFEMYPGVRNIKRDELLDEFLLVTGDKTHYLLPQPSIRECPYHDWQVCHREGVPSDSGQISSRSVDPRSFFISGELHHCAHRDVHRAKSSPITAENRARCGVRSGQDGQAFCEIWRFEQYLCCRTCAFEEVCVKAEVFRLPCEHNQAKFEVGNGAG